MKRMVVIYGYASVQDAKIINKGNCYERINNCFIMMKLIYEEFLQMNIVVNDVS